MKKILVLEDEANIRELVVYTLETTGFEARGFEEGTSFFEALAEELERFREDPVVDDFFRAELAFCRMMQEVNLRVTEAIDFDMEFPL